MRKHDSDDESDSDSHDEYEAPSYDQLANLLKQYTSIIRKSNEKTEKLKLQKNNLVDKCGNHETRFMDFDGQFLRRGDLELWL